MCNSNELRAVSHSWEVGAKRSDMLIERQRYVGPGGGIAMGLKHGPGTRVRSARRRKRGHTDGIGSRAVWSEETGKGGTGGGSVCNSPRWCEAMRCDRSAMSCGRPDGPAAVPAAQLSTPTMSIPDPVTAYVLIPA